MFNKKEIERLTQILEEKDREIERLSREFQIRNSVLDYIEHDNISISKDDYFAEVAIFFHNIMLDQLDRMITDQQNEMSKIGWTDRETDIFRSNINCLRLIKEWGQKCTSLHFGNIQENKVDALEEDN